MKGKRKQLLLMDSDNFGYPINFPVEISQKDLKSIALKYYENNNNAKAIDLIYNGNKIIINDFTLDNLPEGAKIKIKELGDFIDLDKDIYYQNIIGKYGRE